MKIFEAKIETRAGIIRVVSNILINATDIRKRGRDVTFDASKILNIPSNEKLQHIICIALILKQMRVKIANKFVVRQ